MNNPHAGSENEGSRVLNCRIWWVFTGFTLALKEGRCLGVSLLALCSTVCMRTVEMTLPFPEVYSFAFAIVALKASLTYTV